jgi:hypothetical protein
LPNLFLDEVRKIEASLIYRFTVKGFVCWVKLKAYQQKKQAGV